MGEPTPTPPARATRWRLVLACGLVTTAIVLFLVYLFSTVGFHPMGFYVNYVIPLGAIGVGLAAASGYGLASWFSGVKITRWLLVIIVVFQVFAYFEAQYIEFRSLKLVREDGSRVGFVEYFDVTTRSFTWEEDGKQGKPLGLWGYGVRALEIAGFVLGSLIVPLMLWKKPYCDGCGMYFRHGSLGLIPAGLPPKKFKRRETEAKQAYLKAQEQAWLEGQALLGKLLEAAKAGDGAQFQALFGEHKPRRKEYDKLTRRIELALDRCPGCDRGILSATGIQGKGDKTTRTALARGAVAPQFVRALRHGGAPEEPAGKEDAR